MTAAPTTPAEALAALEAAGDPVRAAEMAAYHKTPRRYLGLAAPEVYALADRWRAERGVADRAAFAARLWDSDVHEARMAASKLLTQARIAADEPVVWAEVLRWVPTFDGCALADHACRAVERRLVAVPARLDLVDGWTRDPNRWVRRAALVATLPWTRSNHPTPAETAARDRILGWAAALVADRDRFVRKAVAWWVRSLSRHDPERAHAFLAGPGAALAAFALEARRPG